MTISFAYYELSCASGYFDQDVLDRTTEWVMGICDGQDSCRSGLCTLIQKYGDPYPGCRKDFYVKAEYFNGVRISDQVMPEAGNRDKFFSLQCPLDGGIYPISFMHFMCMVFSKVHSR